jgi:Uma2 family endonuclease
MLLVTPMSAIELPEHASVRRLKRSEYERLADLGAFENEKVELLDGIIYEMSPQGREHSDLVALLNELVVKALPPTHQLRPQLPFALSDYSMPEPDLVVVPRRPFGAGHPTEAVWMVEVAASSLAFDRDFKMRLYATGNVPEYWIVNADELQIEVHRDPSGPRYRSVLTYDRFARINPLAFPALGLCLDDLIGVTGT